MDALYANNPKTVSGINRVIMAAQLLLIIVILSVSAQDFLYSGESTRNMLNNEITQSTNSAQRFSRYEGPKNVLRTKKPCKNSVVGKLCLKCLFSVLRQDEISAILVQRRVQDARLEYRICNLYLDTVCVNRTVSKNTLGF